MKPQNIQYYSQKTLMKTLDISSSKASRVMDDIAAKGGIVIKPGGPSTMRRVAHDSLVKWINDNRQVKS